MTNHSSAWRFSTGPGSTFAALVFGATMLCAPCALAQSRLADLDAATRAAADEVIVELEKSYTKPVNKPAMMNACVKGVARGRAAPKAQLPDDDETDYCLRSMIAQLETKERYFNLQQAMASQQRKPVAIATVETTYPAPHIAMIQMSAGAWRSPARLADALDAAKSAAVKGIILDLRGNDSDDVPTSASVASAFLPMQTLVTTVKIVKAGNNEEMRVGGQYLSAPEMAALPARLQGIALATPLVILVDEKTGGTAEIVAAALQDHRRATIVGRQTAGKAQLKFSGSVLHGGFFSMTVGEFVRPSGKTIDAKGVTPDRSGTAERDLATALALLPH